MKVLLILVAIIVILLFVVPTLMKQYGKALKKSVKEADKRHAAMDELLKILEVLAVSYDPYEIKELAEQSLSLTNELSDCREKRNLIECYHNFIDEATKEIRMKEAQVDEEEVKSN